jgi:hypothetical protein
MQIVFFLFFFFLLFNYLISFTICLHKSRDMINMNTAILYERIMQEMQERNSRWEHMLYTPPLKLEFLS